MAYREADGRQQLLDVLGEAIDHLHVAMVALGEAYEALDDTNADRLEAELFRPVQAALGRATRVHSAFAARVGLASRTWTPPAPRRSSGGPKGFVDQTTSAVASADQVLATLQDSMLPVDVGDAELRSGLGEVRTLVGEIGPRARRLLSTLGR